MRKSRSQGIKFPKRIDVSRLRDMNVRKDLQEALESEQFDGTWDQFRTKIYKTCVETLGLKKRKHRDWFDENDHQINTFLDEKNKLYQKYLGASVKTGNLPYGLSEVRNRHSNAAYAR